MSDYLSANQKNPDELAEMIRPGADGRAPAAPHRPGGYDGTTYYGRPFLKQSPFEWVVPAYIFLGGMAGAAQLLSTIADFSGHARARGVVRSGRWLALLGALLGPPLLIADLKTPQRFYNMLRIFRRSSAMSIGSYILVAFSSLSTLTAILQFTGDRLSGPWQRWLHRGTRAAAVPAAIAGAGMSTYTATLLSATSTPLWAAAPRELAVRFGSSSVAAGAAALSLIERRDGDPRMARDLDTLALIALTAEFAATLAAQRRWRDKGVAAAERSVPWGSVDRIGATGIGIMLPFALHAGSALLGRRASSVSPLASFAILAGSLAMRCAVQYAGDASAIDPRDGFRLAQRRNLPRSAHHLPGARP